jgi:hypothetical protein
MEATVKEFETDSVYKTESQSNKDSDMYNIKTPDREVEPAQDDLFIRSTGGYAISDEEFIERSLEENRFFLRTIFENIFAMKSALPDEATEYREKADNYQRELEKLLSRALHETPNKVEAVKKLNEDSIELLYEAADFCEKVYRDNVEGKYRGLLWTKVAEHIRREPLYVIKTLQRLNSRIERPLREDIIEENEFYLKIMAEHSSFLVHFLDMDEDELSELARVVTTKFKLLTIQARNVEIEPPSKTAILSQLTIFRGATILLHDFLVEVSRLAGTGEIRGIVDPNLMGHVTREAAKYLSVIDRLEARVKMEH